MESQFIDFIEFTLIPMINPKIISFDFNESYPFLTGGLYRDGTGHFIYLLVNLIIRLKSNEFLPQFSLISAGHFQLFAIDHPDRIHSSVGVLHNVHFIDQGMMMYPDK